MFIILGIISSLLCITKRKALFSQVLGGKLKTSFYHYHYNYIEVIGSNSNVMKEIIGKRSYDHHCMTAPQPFYLVAKNICFLFGRHTTQYTHSFCSIPIYYELFWHKALVSQLSLFTRNNGCQIQPRLERGRDEDRDRKRKTKLQ